MQFIPSKREEEWGETLFFWTPRGGTRRESQGLGNWENSTEAAIRTGDGLSPHRFLVPPTELGTKEQSSELLSPKYLHVPSPSNNQKLVSNNCPALC